MRKKINLNGIWKFAREGKTEEIKVPSNWYLQGHDIFGIAEYSRELTIQKSKHKRYFLVFEGVDYFTEAYLNNKLVGKHEGYFQKFRFDVTKQLKDGDNKLKVVVNSPKEDKAIWPDKKILIKGIFNHHDARPGSWNKEWGQDKNTGGIWNNVYIEAVDEVEIESVKITPYLKQDGIWNSGSSLIINNYTDDTLEAELDCVMAPENFKGKQIKHKRAVTLKPGVNVITMHFDLDEPQLWWSWDYGKPNLYNFSYELKTDNGIKDNISDVSGIRNLKKGDDNSWYLNGKRIFLRGTNIIPTQWLSEYTNAKIKKDVDMIRSANMNIIRVHAHVNRKELYEEFDRQGIMVWQDFALQWGYETSDTFMENASSQIKDMINLHYNRPSIVIWCCHNEPFVNEKQLDPVLHTKAKEEDSVRYIEQASDFKQHHYQGWYYDDNFANASDTYGAVNDAYITTEFGAQALPDVSTMKKMMDPQDLWPPNWEKWEYHDFQHKNTFNIAKIRMGDSLKEFVYNSQKYQADLIKEHIEVFRRLRFEKLNGIIHFMFCECWPSITWAVVDYYRKPKMGYDALKKAFQPVLPGFRLMTTTMAQGEIIGFGILWKMAYVVNDTFEDIKGSSMTIKLQGPDKKVYFDVSKKIKKIEADSVSRPFDTGSEFDSFDGDKFSVPQDAKTGKHKLIVMLKDKDGKTIGENDYEFEVVEAVRKMKDQYQEDY